MWDSTLRFVGGLRRFSLLFGLQPMVRREAEALKHVSMALEKVHPLEWRVNVPAYLKQGSPNLFRLEASRVMPSLLQMFQDVQGSMPHASQVLVCFGLPDMCEEEQLRLFLLRCMLSNSLHVLLLPESLSYKAQEYFTSLWRFLVQELQASAGQKKYLLALVVSQRSCLLLDFFRAYQQDPPQLRVDLLRTQIQERCTIVWSQTTCAGKSTWVKHELQGRRLTHTSVSLNEHTSELQLITQLQSCCRWRRGAIVLCISPLVQALWVDVVVFRLLVLRRLVHEDGTPFLLDALERLYLEVPNVLDETSPFRSLAFFDLAARHEARMELNTDHGDLQLACRYLRTCHHAVLGRVMQEHVGREECRHLLEHYGPRTASDVSAIGTSPVLVIYFARLLCHLFEHAMPLLRRWHRGQSDVAVIQFFTKSICDLAGELASRHLLRNSFLDWHCNILQIPEDRGRSFPLLYDWGLRIVLIPHHGDRPSGFDVHASGFVPVVRAGSLKFLNQAEKKLSSKVGLDIKPYAELRSGTVDTVGEGEILLNKIFGMCDNTQALLQHVNQVRRDPRLLRFALTVDNILKMVALYHRVTSGVPVVIMGESGCGKSAVVCFLAKFLRLRVFTLDVHGGLEEEDILKFMDEAIAAAFGQPNEIVWTFLDEINTASCVGLFRELICDRTMQGTPLPENLKVFAACNPYRLKQKWHETGGFQATDAGTGEQQIAPLTDLVYAVYPLPASLIACAWDFGMLSTAEEERYVNAILKSLPYGSSEPRPMRKLMAIAVLTCHKFMRKWDVAAVSLRDVARVAKLTAYYQTKLEHRDPTSDSLLLKAFFVSLCLCYWFRLSSEHRSKLLETIEWEFGRAWTAEKLWLDDGRWRLKEAVEAYWPNLPEGWYKASFIEELIQEEMTHMINALLPLPPGVAPNGALRENLFVMILCIDARLPLVLVGKPGSSKSLAMQIIRDKFHRETKPSKLSHYPDIAVFPYQCSKHSHAKDGSQRGVVYIQSSDIEGRFEDARKYEQDPQEDRRGVVFLDEVGLAERSPNLPLKVLHKLLEMPEKQVSFVGLSNWALDAAKMNRCLLLSRGDAKKEELRSTAEAILGGAGVLVEELDRFCSAFMEVCVRLEEAGFANFVGLRDFYAFIKLLDRSLEGVLSPQLFISAVQRSFGGLPDHLAEVVLEPFYRHCLGIGTSVQRVAVAQLLQANLADLAVPDRAQVGARHLMVFGPSAATAAQLLEEELETMASGRHVAVVVGSSFPRDRSVGAIYQNIARIKQAMETGGCVMLVHAEDIYEALYDMLNQFYTRALGRTLCRLAIGAESRQCDVHPAFRCIVVADAEKAKSYEAPLLNRFEKQQIDFSSFLHEDLKALLPQLDTWMQGIAGGVSIPLVFIGASEHSLFALLMAAQRRHMAGAEALRWVQEQLLRTCTAEAWCRHVVQGGVEVGWKASAHRSFPAFLMEADSRGYVLDWLLYTFSSTETALEELITWDARVLKLASTSSEEDAQRHVRSFFKGMQKALVFQVTLEEGNEELSRMMQHLMRMVANARRDNRHPSKWVIFVAHIVKSSRALRLPLHYLGSGFSVALLDELAEPKPWEETVLSHTGGDWDRIVSQELLTDIARKNAWKLAAMPMTSGTDGYSDEVVQRIQLNRQHLLELLQDPNLREELLYYSLHSLSQMDRFDAGWQAKIKDSEICRAGSFRRAQIRCLELKLTTLVERFLMMVAVGSTGHSFFLPPDLPQLWQSALRNEALREVAGTAEIDGKLLLSSVASCRSDLRCPFGVAWRAALDGACRLVQDHIRRGIAVNLGIQQLREICQQKGLHMSRWLDDGALRLYGRDLLVFAVHTSGTTEQLDLDMLLEVALSYARHLASEAELELSMEILHFAVKNAWPLLPHMAKLSSSGLRTSLLDFLSFNPAVSLDRLVAFVLGSLTTGEACDACVVQLQEAELLLLAMSQICQLEGQPTGELERQRRDLSFLKLALCGLVLPLRLRLSLQDLHATFCSMQSGQLQLKELGQLLMVFHPKSRAWSTRLWQWATGEDPKEVDLSMVREFLSSTIAQSPGLEGELGMAIYFALGRVIAIDDDLLSAVRWLESCVGGSLLSISTRIQLARRLLSSTPEVTLALEAVVEDESRRVGHRDHQVAAILLQACQEELESRGTSLNDLRCHLSGLVTTGLNFLWAMAAARMILVKAAETVRRQTPHLETSESAMELLQLDATPSRRAFEVFLAKQLNLDRIDLARLQRQSDTSELWRFLRFPAILDGLPPPSTLGHEICPSDCLLSMLGDEYSTLKDAILSPSTSSMTGRAGPVATVMAAFSTAFLSHFRRQHPMPAARELNLQHRELRTLLDAMLQNFPRSPGWQIHGNTTPEWVFMVRPIIHMAAMSQTDAEQSLWWRIFSSPQDLQRCLWPFMPEDEAAAALAALRENVKMYTCRCGFRYAVGECGQPMEQRRCPGCNQQIGGREHRPAAGNRRVDQVNQAAARPGFLDTRHEGDRQTCRGLNVDQLRCARYFLHGLLSLGCGTRSQSFGGLSAADLMERMKGDWQVLRTLHGWTPERLSERLHVLVLRGYCLSCPHSTLRRESLERDWSLFVGAAQSTAFTNMNRGRSPAEEKLAEELEESQTISCLASREREAMLPSLLRRWTPLDSLHMQEDLRSDPALMEKYQLVFEVVNSETDLFIASQLEPIVSFQNFLLGRFQGRWSKVEAQKLNVEQVLEEVPADRDQAAKLFAAAQKAWNLVAPQVDRFECQDIQIPQMSENPQEVPIMWWLRSESSDCPQSLKSLVLLRWLVDKHNAWLTHAARAPEMQHDAIQAPCCLTDALQPYFLHYEQGKVQLWAKEATQVHCTSKPERFDYAMVAGRVHELFMGARPVDRDRIEMYIFRSEGRAARPQFQTSLSEAGQELLLRLLSTGPQQDKCLQLLLQMEAWLRVAPRNDGMTAAEFARTKMPGRWCVGLMGGHLQACKAILMRTSIHKLYRCSLEVSGLISHVGYATHRQLSAWERRFILHQWPSPKCGDRDVYSTLCFFNTSICGVVPFGSHC
ncbi:unnamed protein product [Durusdinium trenchii]|uniref:RZ-type domain-containing protein n=1 Tax=Durusdinium trenchii TaxID=1381693 RepID=A0ABP0HSY3_9DINO